MDQDEDASLAVSGIPLDELEATVGGNADAFNSNQPLQPTEEQRSFLKEAETARRAKSLAIPTDDALVRRHLRICAEPVTLFGEGPYDRRERLRRLLAERPALQRRLWEETTNGIAMAETQARALPSGAPLDTDEFYVPGSEELRQWRLRLVQFSLERAKERLKREIDFRSQPAAVMQAARLSLIESARRLQLHNSQVASGRPLSTCSLSPDQTLIATGDFGGSCRIWNRHDMSSPLHELAGVHEGSRLGRVAFNPRPDLGASLASCDALGRMALWSLGQSSSVLLSQLHGHTARVASLAFHPSGALLGSASYDYSWRLWDVEHAKELQLQEGHSQPVYSLAFHNDGALAATGGLDAHGRVWDLRLGRAIWTLQGHLRAILSMAFQPRMPLLASSSEDGTVRIWDLRKLQPITIIPAHPSAVSRVTWATADVGELLLTAGFEGDAKLWAAPDWRLLTTLKAHEGKILDADCSPNGQLVITAGQDHTIKVWQ